MTTKKPMAALGRYTFSINGKEYRDVADSAHHALRMILDTNFKAIGWIDITPYPDDPNTFDLTSNNRHALGTAKLVKVE